MQRLTFEKICLVSCLAFLSILSFSTEAHAASLQAIIVGPAGIKLQIAGLLALYIAIKVIRPENSGF